MIDQFEPETVDPVREQWALLIPGTMDTRVIAPFYSEAEAEKWAEDQDIGNAWAIEKMEDPTTTSYWKG